MSVTIKHKTSNNAATYPDKSEVAPGEFAINTATGELYIKKLVDPALGDIEANTVIYAIRRPAIADGGEIIPEAPSRNILLADMRDGLYNYDWYN